MSSIDAACIEPSPSPKRAAPHRCGRRRPLPRGRRRPVRTAGPGLALGAGTLDEHTAPFTHVVETTGYPSVLTQYTDRIADAAKISLVGISTGTIGLDYRTVVRRQLTLSGSLIYDHPVGFARVIDSVVSGNVVPARTIDAQYDFDDTSTAFSRARAVGGKSVFLF
jgi:threonine dehydrogenase-like Zn-dependent dehydrogenase